MKEPPDAQRPWPSLALIAAACFALASCGGDKPPKVDVKRLATDVHVSIAGHTLVLPFIALEDFAYRKEYFSFDPEGDRQREREAASKLLADASNPGSPLHLDVLSVVVRTYGWNDADMRQREMCPLLTREWARSVCDNPWAAIQQALPLDRFSLVDFSQVLVSDHRGPLNCVGSDDQRESWPPGPGKVVIVCRANVYGTRPFYSAAVRIEGDLGALWTVWESRQNAETAEAMANREGEAIVAFVRNALGASENFSTLHEILCRLRRPGSADGPGNSVSGCTEKG